MASANSNQTDEPIFATRNSLPDNARRSLAALLNQQLADMVDLYSQTKQAHWNVRGPQFIALHELFDTLAEQLEIAADQIAERALALGGAAHGTVRQAAAASRLPEFPPGLHAGLACVQTLADRWAVAANATREAIGAAEKLKDAGTADLLTGLSRELDKGLWFLEAHLG